MANGLKPIGESIKPIIDRIKKEREERRKRKGNKITWYEKRRVYGESKKS